MLFGVVFLSISFIGTAFFMAWRGTGWSFLCSGGFCFVLVFSPPLCCVWDSVSFFFLGVLCVCVCVLVAKVFIIQGTKVLILLVIITTGWGMM